MTEWTIDTLKEHVEMIFASRAEATQIAMDAAQRAVDKAERLADIRAENQDRMAREMAVRQNEWRSTVNDIIAERLTRREWEQGHQALLEKVEHLNARFDRHEGGSKQTSMIIPWVIAAAGIVIGLVSLLIDFSH